MDTNYYKNKKYKIWSSKEIENIKGSDKLTVYSFFQFFSFYNKWFTKLSTLFVHNIYDKTTLKKFLLRSSLVYKTFVFNLTKSELDNDIKLENHVIKSYDSWINILIIKTWLCNSKKWIIISHGFGSNIQKSILYGLDFLRKKYNILLFDQRGHGKSTGGNPTMGYLENKDLKKIQDFLIKKFNVEEVNFLGWSMGGFSTLAFLKKFYNKDLNKFAIIDSPAENLLEIWKEIFKKMNLDWYYYFDLIRKLWIKKYNYDPILFKFGEDLESIKNLPILFIINKKDKVINPFFGIKVFENKILFEKNNIISKKIEYDLGHAQGITYCYQKYIENINIFINKINMKKNKNNV